MVGKIEEIKQVPNQDCGWVLDCMALRIGIFPSPQVIKMKVDLDLDVDCRGTCS